MPQYISPELAHLDLENFMREALAEAGIVLPLRMVEKRERA